MKAKKGDVWVSAILYFGLGIVVLTIILAAGTPVINKLRDKNIVLQTKEVFQVLDSNIREVAREGPGAQRPITMDIRKGEFKIVNENSSVRWQYDSKALLAEPCAVADFDTNPGNCPSVQEGNLKIIVRAVGPSKSFPVRLSLEYDPSIYVRYDSPVNIITGNTQLIIRNDGVTCGPNTDLARNYAPPQDESSSTENDICTCDGGIQTTGVCQHTSRTTVTLVQRAS